MTIRGVLLASAGLTLAGAATIAWVAAGGADLTGVDVVLRLRRYGEPVYAAALAWLLLAPFLMVGAGLALRRTPWPWVGCMTMHLLVVVGLATRFRALVPAAGWLSLGVVVVVGLVSVVAASSTPTGRTRG